MSDTIMQAFLARERPDVNPNTTFKVVSLDNGTNPQGPSQAGYAFPFRMRASAILTVDFQYRG
jgi:hypothetical protein